MPAPLQVVPFGGGEGGGWSPPEKWSIIKSFFSYFKKCHDNASDILLVSLNDCLPYLDENIHLYEAQCLTKYFAKWEDKNLEKRNK